MSGTNQFMDMALTSGKYSDLTIRCKGVDIKVHKIIVCPHSKPLSAMVDGEFLEARTGIIDLPDDEPHIVSRMIQFIYTSEYDDTEKTNIQPPASPKNPAKRRKGGPKKSAKASSSAKADARLSEDMELKSQEALITNTLVYIIGEKYDIPALKKLAASKYEAIALKYWECSFFADSIALLYENTMTEDRLLKDLVVDVAHRHRVALLKRSDFAEMLIGCGEFGLEMLRWSACITSDKPDGGDKQVGYWCQACRDYTHCPECQESKVFHEVLIEVEDGDKNDEGERLRCADSSCKFALWLRVLNCDRCGQDSLDRDVQVPSN